MHIETVKFFFGIILFVASILLVSDRQVAWAEDNIGDNKQVKRDTQETISKELVAEDLPVSFRQDLKAKKNQANKLLERLTKEPQVK